MCFARIDLEIGQDLIAFARDLRSRFKKVHEIYFPPKEKRGDDWYGFSFQNREPLYDWKSICQWCNLQSRIDLPENVAMVIANSRTAGRSKAALPFLSSILKTNEQCNWSFEFNDAYGERYRLGARLKLDGKMRVLGISIRQPKYKGVGNESNATRAQFWTMAKSHFDCLDGLQIDFVQDKKGQVGTPKIKSSDKKRYLIRKTNEDESIFVNLADPLEWKPALKQCCSFAAKASKILALSSEEFDADLTSDIAPSFYRNIAPKFDSAILYFDGSYKQDFHPDDVLTDFPKEGFWKFPLFAFELKGDDDELGKVSLIQTPKGRFFEIEAEGEDRREDLEKYLGKIKPAIPITFWEGDATSRWGLDKLASK